jgi:hypothetical protein
MGSKEAKTLMGGTGCQSGLLVMPTPLLVPRPNQLLCKKLPVIKRDTVFHDVIRRPRQFARKGTVSNHEKLSLLLCGCTRLLHFLHNAEQTQQLRKRPMPNICCRFSYCLFLLFFHCWSNQKGPYDNMRHSPLPWGSALLTQFRA